MPLPRTAAVYIRVSTEDQAELSPDSQLDAIRQYAEREQIEILQDYIYVDAGISGKRAERRPAFMKMIAAAKEKPCPFTVILLWKYSRFARNQEESVFYKSVLRSKCGIEVLSVTEPLAAGPFGSLIERIIEWMDEFYSIRLGQEVKRSMTVNARRGRLQCAAAFGYRVEEGRLVPDEREAGLIPYIFEGFLSGKGLFPIAKELNAMGVRTHRGNPFESRTVEYILRNPVYTGRLRWNPAGRTRRDFSSQTLIVAEAGHQPLISQEIWDAAQSRLNREKAQRSPGARPAAEQRRWLSGVVRCAACGGTLVFSKPNYYKCGNYTRGRCPCSQHIRCDLLEEAVLSQLTADTQSAGPLSYQALSPQPRDERQRAVLRAALGRMAAQKNRLQNAYLAGVLELADFSKTKRELERSEEQIRRELAALQVSTEKTEIQRTLAASAAEALETLWAPDASQEQRGNAIRAVLENCVFDKAASLLTIVYRTEL